MLWRVKPGSETHWVDEIRTKPAALLAADTQRVPALIIRGRNVNCQPITKRHLLTHWYVAEIGDG